MSIKELKLKYFCKVKDGTHDTPQYVDGTDDTFPLVTSKDITNGNLSFNNAKHISYEDYLAINRRSNVEKYDVIMPMIGTVGNPAIVMTDKPFSIKNVALFKTSPNIAKSKYLKYMLDSSYIKEQFNLNSRGGVQSFVSLSVLENLKILMPENLDNVICYLDKKTNKVDALINNKLKLINLLEQQRQSIITEAVTKGLNSNVKMKDSCVEWIGEIPKQWKAVKLGWYISIFGSVEITDGNFKAPLFKVNDLNTDKDKLILTKSNNIVDNNTSPIVGNKILIPKRGAAIFTNKVRIVNQKCYIDSNIMAIVPKKEFNIEYLAYLLWARKLGDIADTSTIPQINNKQINPLKVPLPPLEEQNEIVCYIEDSSNNILILIKNIKYQIDKLKEYRQSLIYEAVTGKIDVRDMELD